MQIHRSMFPAAILAFAVAAFLAPTPSHADTYEIFDLGSGHRRAPMGITDSGTVVLFGTPGLCPGSAPGGACYETWTGGIQVSNSGTNPSLTFDNGTPCTPNVPPAFVGNLAAATACNGAREVYGTSKVSPIDPRQIFDGPDPLTNFVTTGELDEVMLNSSGDFLFAYDQGALGVDGDGFIAEAFDLTTRETPEPSSLLLLGTGVIAAFGTMRRRSLQQK